MLEYIKSEMYRAIKTKWYVNLLKIACLFVTTEFVYFLLSSRTIDYFDTMITFFKFFALIVIIAVMVVIYKRKDIKVALLSMGLSRTNIFIGDLISLQLLTIFSVLLLGALAVFGGIIAKLIFYEESGVRCIEFVLFIGKLVFYMININNGILGLSYLFNNVALGVTSSFIILPSVFQITMFETEGKIYDIANGLLLIQPFKLMEIGMDSENFLNEYFLLINILPT